MKVAGLIPARIESKRLPGKALIDICGLPAIVHTYKRCLMAKKLNEVYVVTDSDAIRDTVESHGGRVIMTGPHRNGSERIHEASLGLDCDIAMLINGDEVLVFPEHIDRIAEALIDEPKLEFTIGVTRYDKANCPQDFKAVLDLKGNLLYGSREDIPSSSIVAGDDRLKMVFIVGFTKASLAKYVAWPETPLEAKEFNEFMRILEHGGTIRCIRVEGAKISLDTAVDLKEIQRMMGQDKLLSIYATPALVPTS